MCRKSQPSLNDSIQEIDGSTNLSTEIHWDKTSYFKLEISLEFYKTLWNIPNVQKTHNPDSTQTLPTDLEANTL